MKELSIEEKAQRFDEALAKAKESIAYIPNDVVSKYMLNMFPELKESEDERIRKSLIELVQGIYMGCCTEEAGKERDMFLAWLEKQGDNLVKNGYTNNKDFIKYADKYSHEIWHKLMDNFKNIKDYHIGCNDVSDIVLNAIIDTCNWLEKQGSNVDNANKEYWRGYREGKQEILDKYAELEKQGKQKLDTDFSSLRTWKYIVDAVWTEKEGIGQYLDSPFTEEVAKKLQKRFGNIEPKPSWSEEDEAGLGDALWAIQQARAIAKDENDMGNLWYAEKWLKSFKNRVQPKQEWSEEDKAKIVKLKSFIAQCKGFNKENRNKAFDLIDSIKPRYTWKPSEEQMDALRYVTNFDYGGYKAMLISLYEQLKKL